MAKKLNLIGRARSAWSVFDAARTVAAELESGRKPSRRSLERLGIDPEAFTRMG